MSAHISNDDSQCPICMENMTNTDSYIIPECNHKFHSACITTWFRYGNTQCPYCNDIPDILKETKSKYVVYSKSRLNMLIKYAKNIKAPSELGKLITKRTKIKNKIKTITQEIKELKNSLCDNYIGKTLNEVNKLNLKLKTNQHKNKYLLRRVELEICRIEVHPIIIPIKKYI